MFPKVSVVVPIYKVENYLRRCIESIINQSYKNIEIILVNDGSPDSCGIIAEEYSKKDKRIKVIHKENGGLSDARNYGMKYIRGDYTLFVDSDDWLELDMIETLINISIEFNADIVQSGFYYAYEDYLLFDDRYYSKDTLPIILDNQSLMRELVSNEKVKNFAWGKLYKTNIIKDIYFKKGVLFEDVFWAHKVMHSVNKYVIINKPLCYYLQRSDSIVGNYSYKNLSIIDGLIERHVFIEENYQSLKYESYKSILKNCLIHYNLLQKNSRVDPDKKYRKKIEEYIFENYTQLKESTIYDRQLNINLSVFMINPSLTILNRYINKVLKIIKIVPTELNLKRIEIYE